MHRIIRKPGTKEMILSKKKAIVEWKRMHPFFNSTLIKRNEDFYFSLVENNNDFKSVFRNVQILSNETIQNHKYLIELLVE